MRAQERLPRRLPFSLRCWLDAVRLEGVAHGPVRDLIAKIGQCSLDPIVAPGGILSCHLDNELDHFFRHRGPSRALPGPAAGIPLRGNQLSVPTQDGVGRVTIVATRRNAARPRILPLTAKRRR